MIIDPFRFIGHINQSINQYSFTTIAVKPLRRKPEKLQLERKTPKTESNHALHTIKIPLYLVTYKPRTARSTKFPKDKPMFFRVRGLTHRYNENH